MLVAEAGHHVEHLGCRRVMHLADDEAVGEEEHAIGLAAARGVVRDHHDAAEVADRVAQQAEHLAARESRLPVGSSAKTTAGSVTSARAIATRCCWPPESSAGRWARGRRADAVEQVVEPARAPACSPARRSAGRRSPLR